MQFLVCYFSGTGNTWWAVQAFKRFAEESGHSVDTVSIETIPNYDEALLFQQIDRADIVGFAYPIYGAGMPPIMRQFLDRLAAARHQRVLARDQRAFVITTVGFINSFGPFAARFALKRAGFNLWWHVNVRLANNISRPGLKMASVPAEVLEKRKNEGLKDLASLFQHLTTGQKYIKGIGPYLLPGIIIRRVSAPRIQRNYQSFSVDLERCTRCLNCVHHCPTQSIGWDGAEFSFAPSCTACMRCYNFCPKAAILFDGVYADPSIYARYRGPDPDFNVEVLR
jgi:NAD-dependent dihydropyrimidine dehydrogenase PreA subunit